MKGSITGMIALMLLVLSSSPCQAITDDEYVEVYFNMAAVYYQDPSIKEEFLDMIEYFLQNSNVDDNLFKEGERSGRQIRTILDKWGGPCEKIDNAECKQANPCLSEGDTCCCGGKLYTCSNPYMQEPMMGPMDNLIPSVHAELTASSWQQTKDCGSGCCGRVCCEGVTGDNCYSNEECYVKYGACYVCPNPGGECTKGAQACTTEDECINAYGPGWKCDKTELCCIPGDSCATNDDCGLIYGPNWVCETTGNCKYVGTNVKCEDETLMGECNELKQRCMDGPFGDAILVNGAC
ncbi:MAG: hypothetical protein JW724_06660 [Candidatus Altiarchaeota archaeon]|nr:hypothetical protein [Candidatus Altiarchaeota archaeon]